MSRRVPVSEMASTEQLAQLLHKDRAQLERLTAENAGLWAALKRSGRVDPDRRPLIDEWDLLLDVVEALMLATKVSDAAAGSPELADRVAGSREQPIPGQGTAPARRAARRLRWGLRQALKDFDESVRFDFHPPKSGEPKVWCRNSTCEAKEKRIPKYVGPKGTRIEMAFCQVCNGKLSDA